MPVPGFVDRVDELRILERAWSDRPCLVVIYGRRRVGKTRLVLEWCERSRVKHVYFHAIPAKHSVNLSELARVVERSLGLRGFSRARYESLDALLEALAYRENELAIVIDEFTYWARAEPRVVEELQRFVDHVLPSTRMMIVLVGSLVGVMYRSVIGGGAPLYGRARYRVRLGELEPWYLTHFYPWMGREDVVRMYAMLGGVPHYHTLVDRGSSVREALAKLFLEPGAPLRDEVLFLLREEFRDPSTYYSILKAIAQGASTPSAIEQATGIKRQHVSKYLHVLEQLGLIAREKPLFSKRGRYRVSDKLLATWFAVIEPIVTSIGASSYLEALPEAMRSLELHVASVFEEVARKYIEWLASRGSLRFDEIGKFVHKGVEIDIVAVDKRGRVAHVVEVKWSDVDELEAKRIRRELEAKARSLPLEGFSLVMHLVARSFRGREVEGLEVHTLSDMPFENP